MTRNQPPANQLHPYLKTDCLQLPGARNPAHSLVTATAVPTSLEHVFKALTSTELEYLVNYAL